MHDLFKGAGKGLRLCGGGFDLAVLAQIPVGEELQFALQQGAVVRRQDVGARGALPLQQQFDGLCKVRLGGAGVGGVERTHHGALPQVG